MARGRKPITLDSAEFQGAVTTLENSQTFSNRSSLWAAFEATPYARNNNLKGQTAMLKADALGITLKTPKGQRGRVKGQGPVVRGDGQPRAKRSRRRMSAEAKTALAQVAEGYGKTVEKAASGSMKAAIKLKCLDCTAYDKTEIRYCGILACSLWAFRPYKAKPGTVPLPVVEENE